MGYLALALLFFGESVMILAEERGAKLYNLSGAFGTSFAGTLIPLVVGAVALIIAYMLGLRSFHNIWIVTAVSFGSILIVEPLFDLFYIGNVPTLGSGIGFALAVLGIGAALFIR
jgi:hypothetical protein